MRVFGGSDSGPENSQSRWHLVLTKPNGENSAKTHLERQGYGVYLPRLCHKRLQRGAWRETISALFPRYLFVQLNSTMQSLAPIRSTVGVATVVRFGMQYTSVPEKLVKDLMSREDATGLHRLVIGSIFKVGAVVKIVEGAFAGIDGIFETEDAQDRVTVLLNLLGRETRIRLSSGSIAPAR